MKLQTVTHTREKKKHVRVPKFWGSFIQRYSIMAWKISYQISKNSSYAGFLQIRAHDWKVSTFDGVLKKNCSVKIYKIHRKRPATLLKNAIAEHKTPPEDCLLTPQQ